MSPDPKMGRSIRLGTLSEYRRQENEAVRDEEEGIFRITLSFLSPTTVSITALQKATLNTSPIAMGESSNNIRTEVFSGNRTEGCVFSRDKVSITGRSKNEITLRGRVNIYAEGADAYVLCLSTSNAVGSIILDPEYDSIWSICSGSILDFTKKLANALHQMFLNRECFSEETVGPFDTPGFQFSIPKEHIVFSVSVEISAISYRDKNIIISSDITDENIHEIYGCLDNSAFIKPVKFSREKEIRIIFRPCINDIRTGRRFLSPRLLNPIFVPFAPVLDMVEITSQ